MPSRRERHYSVYIMGSISGTLYIGVSGNLNKRVFQHKFHLIDGFTKKYEVDRLLYWETYLYVQDAIHREKQLKGWVRRKKIALIASMNPHWADLAKDWYPWMKDGFEVKPIKPKNVETSEPPGGHPSVEEACHGERRRTTRAASRPAESNHPYRDTDCRG
jgi:putative endonuclease